MKELVIKIRWGGLGDHLYHSHIPRIAKQEYGYDMVYISRHSNFNHPNTKRLVWDLNPFVDGFVDEDATYPQFCSVPEGKNIVDAVSDFYGFHDCKERMQEPEIYYVPKEIESLQNSVICELNHINSLGVPMHASIKKYFIENGIVLDYQIEQFDEKKTTKEFEKIHSLSALPGTLRSDLHTECAKIDNISILKIRDLEGLCDVIFSCRTFYCLISGPAVLAAALRKSSIILYVDGAMDMFRHSKLHSYINITEK